MLRGLRARFHCENYFAKSFILGRLKPSQRKCRLEHEAEPLISSSVYSYNLCRSQCRFRIALRDCGCIPYFYRSVGKTFQFQIPCMKPGTAMLMRIFRSQIISHSSSQNFSNSNRNSISDKSGKKYPICGPQGMQCLGKMKGETKQRCCRP